MRLLSVALLGLASIAVADITSWNQLLGDIPSCYKTCLDDYYKDSGLETKCGSPDSATASCICSVKAPINDIADEASTLRSCVTSGCSDLSSSDESNIQAFAQRYNELVTQCTSSSSSTTHNGAASNLPGFNAILASGTLMLVGYAL
ncbi:hypothetical protein P175DRAFT_0505428 [Aspergillus ochraceoroseus IBT 24754]|uniref:CFEM domain-containing protein n=2 Tax=Aspergillus ochraceoroseus TaxID=138278 RepID=A0A2T5LKU3_9EURO|nr:uncharacterized protein P175DRAFT_0505428 [Aspergillus ochraceoroseus IBT 24754]KKK15254.1 hypothetical protein AOCH_000393 [Aspergillus ochraceoroseus]PTU16901.1 hypothetical protein P175DRAFT_0505428 [Aspergillus ochraceoroseus IBT 24754]